MEVKTWNKFVVLSNLDKDVDFDKDWKDIKEYVTYI